MKTVEMKNESNSATSQELLSTLLTSLDETFFFLKLGESISQIIPSDQVSIYLLENEESMRLLFSSDKTTSKNQIIKKSQGGIPWHVVQTGHSYMSNDVSRDPLFYREKEKGVKSELIIPIAHKDFIMATIHFQCTQNKYEFGQKDIKRVEGFLKDLEAPLSNMKMYLMSKYLNASLQKAIEKKEAELQDKNLQRLTLMEPHKIHEKKIVSKSVVMGKTLKKVDEIAAGDSHCLLVGEKNSGKGVLARRIHCRSSRSQAPFITLDCSEFEERELELRILGDAQLGTRSLLEGIRGGTLFLNNVDCLSIQLQSRIQAQMADIQLDSPSLAIRLIAGTSLCLNSHSIEGIFHKDFLSFFNFSSLEIPSLRDRQADIRTLGTFFLNENRPVEEHKSLSPGVIKILKKYSWPGNISELREVMKESYVLAKGKIVEEQHIMRDISSVEDKVSQDIEGSSKFLEMTLDELEKRHICRTLDYLNGNKTRAAKVLGITVKTLYNKLHNYNMMGDSKKAHVLGGMKQHYS